MGKAATAVEPDQFVSGVTTFADRIKPHLRKLIALGVVIRKGFKFFAGLGGTTQERQST